MSPALILTTLLGPTAPPATDVQRVDLERGHYFTARAEGLPADEPAPLVVCLHGTDDRAEGALAFWRSLDWRIACTFVAPQGSHAGWREPDLPGLRHMLEHLKVHAAFDAQRVLLAGHSAGGAMAFHLLYIESFPATAAAVTANYVPPNITLEQARRRADVPVFYAVGLRDLNHQRMRDGTALLREAGVKVTMQRPDIGHVQDREVGRQAARWFEAHCRERVQAVLDAARQRADRKESPGAMLAELERIAGHEAVHFADQAQAARGLLAELERPGRDRLDRADAWVRGGRIAEACAEYLAIEQEFGPASLAARARAARLRLEARPETAVSPTSLRDGEEAQAERLWTMIEDSLEASEKRKAAEHCRELLTRFPRSARADEAATTLRSLQQKGE